jgi:hypothetical protein
MDDSGDTRGRLVCTFCRKSIHDVRLFVSCAAGAYICDECVDSCNRILAEKLPRAMDDSVAPDVLKVKDSDTGESHLHVVRVPEGFSLQMGWYSGATKPFDYISVIVSPEDARRIVGFLAPTLESDLREARAQRDEYKTLLNVAERQVDRMLRTDAMLAELGGATPQEETKG